MVSGFLGNGCTLPFGADIRWWADPNAHETRTASLALAGSLVAVAIVACMRTHVLLAAAAADAQGRPPSPRRSGADVLTRQEPQQGPARQSQRASVSLRELIDGGYVAFGDVQAFDGMELTISLAADETRPQEILIRVRLPNGSVIAQLADGSIQQVTRAALDRQDHK